MPNHFHVLLHLTHSGTSLNLMVSACKRFMAYDIVRGLKEQNKENLLDVLKQGVPKKDRFKNKLHQVFKPSFDARLCHSEWMVEQKIDYIHHNPVRGKWNLVDDFARYKHSSAAFYELGEIGSVEITHYKSLGKIGEHGDPVRAR